jgi:hypothetical protein
VRGEWCIFEEEGMDLIYETDDKQASGGTDGSGKERTEFGLTGTRFTDPLALLDGDHPISRQTQSLKSYPHFQFTDI